MIKLKPVTITVTGFFTGRGDKIRTRDPRFWRPVLYQLSYSPLTDEFKYTIKTVLMSTRKDFFKIELVTLGKVLIKLV